MARRPRLRKLAEELGILSAFRSSDGARIYRTSDETREALITAMGLDASTERAARQSLRERLRSRDERMLPPACVRRWTLRTAPTVEIRRPATWSGRIDWWIELRLENGETFIREGHRRVSSRSRNTRLPSPCAPPLGYHELLVRLRCAGRERTGAQRLIVVPARCHSVVDQLGGRKGFGYWVNLYTLHSRRNWGAGDFGDLRDLMDWAAGKGAAFVGVNPLSALRNRGEDISPYSPVSRHFRNPLYLDVAAVPEFASSEEARSLTGATEFREALASVRRADHVEYQTVQSLKLRVMRLLHEEFKRRHAPGGTRRGREYRRYVEDHAPHLIPFATFCAMDEVAFRTTSRTSTSTRRKESPPDLHSPEVKAFQRKHRDDIEFHCYVQFELDRQLALIAESARSRGMPVGLCNDLPLGSSMLGSEAWSRPDLFIRGATIGAPPDEYAPKGQNWNLPPPHPYRSAEDGYESWARLIRNNMRHAGALRIDHILGLQRLFWIPEGKPASMGAYVRYPAEEWMGVLALESARAETVVIGEDLGTVPSGFAKWLARWGVLSTRVLFFERHKNGSFRSSSRYSRRAMVMAATHDLGPLAGFLRGEDLVLRRRAGAITDDRSFREQMLRRDRDRTWLIDRLRRDGLLPRSSEPPSDVELRDAVHAFLLKSPSPLVAFMLDDLAGETEPVNLPGIGPRHHQSWSRRMTRPLEDIIGGIDHRRGSLVP